jgi:hypothetical protein
MSLGLDILLCLNNVFETIRYVAGRAVLSKLVVIRAADYINMIYEYKPFLCMFEKVRFYCVTVAVKWPLI